MPNALLFDILEAIRAELQTLALPGLAAANVVVQKVPGDRSADLPAVKYPCLLIAPLGAERLDPSAGTNLRDDVEYAVRLTILIAETGNQEERFNQFLSWREIIRRAFHNQRLAVAGCFTVRVRPLDVVEQTVWSESNLFMSSLVLHCFAREPRGIS